MRSITAGSSPRRRRSAASASPTSPPPAMTTRMGPALPGPGGGAVDQPDAHRPGRDRAVALQPDRLAGLLLQLAQARAVLFGEQVGDARVHGHGEAVAAAA